MEKPCTVNVTVTECDSVSLVPVTITWKVEAEENVQDSVALPVPVKRVGDTEHDVLFVARSMGLEKPFSRIVLIADIPAEPASAGRVTAHCRALQSWR